MVRIVANDNRLYHDDPYVAGNDNMPTLGRMLDYFEARLRHMWGLE